MRWRDIERPVDRELAAIDLHVAIDRRDRERRDGEPVDPALQRDERMREGIGDRDRSVQPPPESALTPASERSGTRSRFRHEDSSATLAFLSAGPGIGDQTREWASPKSPRRGRESRTENRRRGNRSRNAPSRSRPADGACRWRRCRCGPPRPGRRSRAPDRCTDPRSVSSRAPFPRRCLREPGAIEQIEPETVEREASRTVFDSGRRRRRRMQPPLSNGAGYHRNARRCPR